MKGLAVKVWITLLLALLMGYTSYSVWRHSRPPSEVPYQPVVVSLTTPALDLASFKMTERSGRKMSLEEMRGQVWVGSMFFATCPTACIQLNKTIAALQKDPLFDGVRFVSITVDPADDTPESLRAYANSFGADPQRWLFVRGELPDVSRFGDAVHLAASYKTHSNLLILFNRAGAVRGMFAFDSSQDMDRLRELVPQLLKEKAAAAPRVAREP